jgi:hypothetical protein
MDDRERVLTALSEVYRPEGCAIWMRSANPLLGDESPDALIARGETERVLTLIEALTGGAFL